MAIIREHIRFSPDDKIGHINKEGEIFGYLEDSGEEEYVGRIDYEEGVVYLLDEDEDSEVAIGWLADDNKIIASFEEGDIEIGFVKDNGDLFYYIDDEESQYVGRVEDMSDPVEGAAALLIFFEFEEDEEYDDEYDEDEEAE